MQFAFACTRVQASLNGRSVSNRSGAARQGGVGYRHREPRRWKFNSSVLLSNISPPAAASSLPGVLAILSYDDRTSRAYTYSRGRLQKFPPPPSPLLPPSPTPPARLSLLAAPFHEILSAPFFPSREIAKRRTPGGQSMTQKMDTGFIGRIWLIRLCMMEEFLSSRYHCITD